MNRAMIVGRLTRDPELRHTNGDIAVTRFTVAVSRPFTNQKGERDADFIGVVVWRKQAENVSKYCKKGSLVGVDGRIQSSSYDAQDGSKRYVTEIVADSVQFLETKEMAKQRQNSDFEMPEEPQRDETTDVSDDDPFANFGDSIEISDDQLPF